MMDEGYFAGLPAQASHNGLLRLTPTSPHDQEHHPFSFQSTSTFALHNDGHPPFIFEVQGDTKHQRGETSSNALASSTPLFVSGDIDEDEDDDDARFDSLGLPKRKRALQRLSLTSSIASSIPSTAPSETDPLDYNECEAGAAENQATAFDDATVGRSAARLPDLVHSRSNSTMREIPTAATVFTAFNLSDFISDGAANDGDTAPASATTVASTSSQRIVDDAHSQNLTLTRSSFTTHQRPGLHRDWSSLSASTACSEDAAERLAVPASPYSPSRLSNSSSSSLSASHSAALDLATNSTANMQLSSPLSRNSASLAPPPSDHHHPGHAVHAHLRASDGLGLSPQGGVGSPGDMSRSMSTPQLDLSNPSGSSMAACNPAHIVPGSLTQHQNVGNSSSPSLQNYYPSVSNSGSAIGSPLRLEYNDIVYYTNSTPATPGSPFNDHEQRLWSAAPCESGAPDMLRDDMGQPMMLSYSAPAHKTTFMQRDCDSSPSSPLVPGHPVRFSRPTAHLASQQSSPYHGPHFAPPQGMMHSQNPSLVGSLQGLATPSLYTGIITKRSRGRRVPNNPEEVNNLGKSGKIYTCKVPGCGKCFKRSEHLKRHVRSIHTDEKPYMCPFPNCFKRFSRHDNLNQHARVHAGTAPGEAGSSANSSMAGSVSPTCSPLSLSVSFPSRRPSTQSASGLRHEEAAYGCEDVFTFDADEAEQQPEDSDYDVQHLNLA